MPYVATWRENGIAFKSFGYSASKKTPRLGNLTSIRAGQLSVNSFTHVEVLKNIATLETIKHVAAATTKHHSRRTFDAQMRLASEMWSLRERPTLINRMWRNAIEIRDYEATQQTSLSARKRAMQ